MAAKDVTLTVTGWACDCCAAATTDALKKVPGVTEVATDFGEGTAKISFDDGSVSVADLEQAVAKAGYQAAVAAAAKPS